MPSLFLSSIYHNSLKSVARIDTGRLLAKVSNLSGGEGHQSPQRPLLSPCSAEGQLCQARLTFREHTCYVDPTEGGHVGEVRLTTCGGIEMSVQGLGIDNASIIRGKDGAKPSI